MISENKLYPPINNYTKNLITSKFNVVRGLRRHKGLDIGVPSGTEVLAPEDGIVVDSDKNRGTCGGYIQIKHNNGLITKYCHLKKVMVKPKDNVVLGQVIGLSGGGESDYGKGETSGAHLHFEVKKNGEFLNPENVFDGVQPPKKETPTSNTEVGGIKSYDFSQKTNINSYDFSNNQSNKITLESTKNEQNYSLTDIGNLVIKSFNSKDDKFDGDYTYRPNATKFYCRFKSCVVKKPITGNCYKVLVSHNSKNYTINICVEEMNVDKKNAELNDLVAKIPITNSYIDVDVKLGLTTKVQLKYSGKKQTEPYKFSKSSKKDNAYSTVDTGYSFPKTTKTNSFVEPYDLTASNTTSSFVNPYEFQKTTTTNSFVEPYKFENKIASEKLITEINRIIDIMK